MEYEERKPEDDIVRIAGKPMGSYLTAITIKLQKYDRIFLTAFGKNTDMVFELAEKAKGLFNVKVERIESFEQNDEAGYPHIGIRVVLVKK